MEAFNEARREIKLKIKKIHYITVRYILLGGGKMLD